MAAERLLDGHANHFNQTGVYSMTHSTFGANARSFVHVTSFGVNPEGVEVGRYGEMFSLALNDTIRVYLRPDDFRALVAKMADALDAAAEEAKK